MKLPFLTLFPLLFGVILFLLLPTPHLKMTGDVTVEKGESAPGVGVIPIVENVGQFGTQTGFQTQSEIGTMFLAQDALWLTVLEPVSLTEEGELWSALEESEVPTPRNGVHLRLSFIGSNPTPTIEASNRLTTSINYFQGSDPKEWKTDVPVWSTVRYVDLYPGIDLEIASRDGLPTRRFIVQDSLRANVQDIAVRIEGADDVAVRENGIEVTTDFGEYTLPFFEIEGVGGAAESPTESNENTIHFPFRYEASRDSSGLGNNPLLPSNLRYSTLLGGSEIDNGLAVAVDQQGAIVVAGYTESFNFPTTPGAFDPTTTGYYARNGFITKFNASGTALDYSTYIDSNDTTRVYAIEVDESGQVYATGLTYGDDFPATPNSPTPGFGGVVDGFVLKLTPTGSALVYSILLGGEEVDFARDLALGDDGTVVVGGITTGLGFPVTPGAYDTGNADENRDAFVTRIAPDGSALLYSTLLGGIYEEDGYGVALDSQGSAYIMGISDSFDFPTTPGAYDPTPISFGQYFVTKFTPDGSDLVYSTVVNGQSTRLSTNDITIDQYGAAYVAAHATNPSFLATEGAYDTECGYEGVGCGNPQNSKDGILFKLNPDGSEMVYGTFLGGSGNADQPEKSS